MKIKLRILLNLAMLLLIVSIMLNACQKKVVAPNVVVKSKIDNLANVISISQDSLNDIDIQYDKAKYRQIDSEVVTTGEVLANANLTTKVTSTVAGRVTQVLTHIGDHVKEGQTLLTLISQDIEQAESDLLQAQQQVLADLKSNLIQIDSDMSSGKAQIKYSESTYKRMESLVNEKIASRADYEAAKTQFDKDQINLDTLKTKRSATISLSSEKLRLQTEPIMQKLKLLGLSEEQIRILLKTRKINSLVKIISPTTGIVIQRDVNLGELIDPTKILFTIGNFKTVWLKADVYEKDISLIKEGQPIELELGSFPGQKFFGKLNYVADSVNQETRTLQVRAEVENLNDQLKPKMYARMKICVGEHNELTVPKTAIQEADGNKVVYIPISANQFKEQKVIVGNENGDYVQILTGLKPGEKVVTKGSFELRSETLKES